MLRSVMVFAIMSFTPFLWAAPVEVDAEKFLQSLRPAHPRLMLVEDELAALKRLHQTDTRLQRYVAQVLDEAEEDLTKPMLAHKLVGPRLLSVSRECLERVYTLALAWRWTGEDRYAQAAEANLLTVCAFPDWNPSHFLDTAEMSHAVAIGYDWLYAYLPEDSRAAIRQGLIELGMKPGLKAYNSGAWWTKSEFNWNQVCNSGLLIGALAIAESDPDYAQFIVPRAVASLPRALAAYGPDGAWMEGPGYWHYATRYTAAGLCALQTALGSDYGLSDIEGLSVTGLFPVYTTGPNGLLVNYADSGERSKRRPMACMFWLANNYENDVIADAEHAVLATQTAKAQHIVWYRPHSGQESAARDLDRHFRSPVDIIVMRSAWDDPDALFVGVKGGYNQVNHGHLDLGNFELDALGVRWARDLGADNYNLSDYWDRKPGGKRWQYYRLNSRSHNVLMLDDRDQDARAVAKVLDFQSAPAAAAVTIDLGSTFPERCTKAVREVALIDDRRSVQVQDSLALNAVCTVAWGMTTDAAIAISDDGKSATLSQNDKTLIATLKSPAAGVFSVESAEQEAPQRSNKGVQRLMLRMEAPKGELTISIVLAPQWE